MKNGLDSFNLKIIAIVSMTIDHIACLFTPKSTILYLLMRSIGAVTFPVMAYMVCEGYRKTRNLKKYKVRLVLFSIVSMLPFAFAFGKGNLGLNVGFTLLFGIFMVECYDRIENIWLKWISITFLSFFSYEFDWGFIGTWLILMLYLAEDDKRKIACALAFAVVLFVVKNQINALVNYGKLFSVNTILNSYAFLRHFGFIAAAIGIFSYNGTRKTKNKYLFYIYYPLHMIILGIIARLV